MPQKIIPNLQPRSEVTDGLNFATDDGIQSYRASGAQIKAYILANNNIETAMIKDANVTRAKLDGLSSYASITSAVTANAANDFNLVSTASGAYTITLPSASGLAGRVIRFAKVTSDTNVATVGSYTLNAQGQMLELFSDGTNWLPLTSGMLGINRSTTKYLASNISSGNSNIASLAFSNLIIGKRYQLQIRLASQSSASSSLECLNNSVVVGSARHGQGTDQVATSRFTAMSPPFTAAATTIVTGWSETGSSTLYGNGTEEGTYITLVELNNEIAGNF